MVVTIAYIFMLFVKAIGLLVVMALGAIVAAYGAIFRLILEFESRRSTVSRMAWMAWSMVIAGLVIFIYAGSGFARLIMA
jgi:hypothetical protein